MIKTKPKKMYNSKQVAKGARMEMEHTKSRPKAEKIAMQHMTGFAKPKKPKAKITSAYYSDKNGLPAMERKLKKSIKK